MEQFIKCKHCHGKGHVLNPVFVGESMRLLRKRHRLSLREVAKKMNFSPPYISDLELGRRGWSDELVTAYRRALK